MHSNPTCNAETETTHALMTCKKINRRNGIFHQIMRYPPLFSYRTVELPTQAAQIYLELPTPKPGVTHSYQKCSPHPYEAKRVLIKTLFSHKFIHVLKINHTIYQLILYTGTYQTRCVPPVFIFRASRSTGG